MTPFGYVKTVGEGEESGKLEHYPGQDYPVDSYRISKPNGVSPMVAISAINLLFSSHRKCFGMILNYST